MNNKRNIQKARASRARPNLGVNKLRNIRIYLVFHPLPVCCLVPLTQKGPYVSFKKVASYREGPSKWLLTRPKHSRKRIDTSPKERSPKLSSNMSWLLNMNLAT